MELENHMDFIIKVLSEKDEFDVRWCNFILAFPSLDDAVSVLLKKSLSWFSYGCVDIQLQNVIIKIIFNKAYKVEKKCFNGPPTSNRNKIFSFYLRSHCD